MNNRGWRRVGIVLSVLWGSGVLTLAVLQRFTDPPIEREFTIAVLAPQARTTAQPPKGTGSNASEPMPEWAKAPIVGDEHKGKKAPDFEDFGPVALEVVGVALRPWRVLSAVFLPLLVCWLLAYVIVATVRWVRDGFRDPGK